MEANEKVFSREDALISLDHEIGNLENQQSKNGINYWVIIAAFGSMFWALTSEMKNTENFQLQQIALVYLFFSLFLDQLKAFNAFVIGKPFKTFRLKPLDEYRRYFLFNLLEASSWLILLIYFKSALPAYVHWPLLLYSLFTVIVLSFVLFTEKFKSFYPPIDLEKTESGYVAWTISFIFTIIFSGILSFISFGIFFCENRYLITVSDWRIGGLAFGFVFVTRGFVWATDIHVLNVLKDIRSSLILRKIDPESAMEKMFIATRGNTFTELFLINYYEKIDSLKKECEKGFVVLRDLNAELKGVLLKRNQDNESSKSKLIKDKVKEYLRVCEKCFSEVNNFEKYKNSEILKINFYLRFKMIDLKLFEKLLLDLNNEFSYVKKIELNVLNEIKGEISTDLSVALSENNLKLSKKMSLILGDSVHEGKPA